MQHIAAKSTAAGFVSRLYTSNTLKQSADYLPDGSNVNNAKIVGVSRVPHTLEDAETVWEHNMSVCFVPKIFENGSSLDMVAPPSVENRSKDIGALFRSARHGKYGACAKMLDEGTSSVNDTDSHGNTLLHVACQNGNKRISKLFLRSGGKIGAQNIQGNTALHYCFAYGHHELGNYLIKKGADDSILNAKGLTCYEGLGP